MLSFNVAKKNKTKKTGSFTSQQLKLYSLRRSNDSAARRKTEDLLFLKKRKGRKKNSIKFCRRRLKTTTTTVTIYRTTYITHLDKLGHEAGPQCRERSRGMRFTCDFLSFQTCKGCWLALVGKKLNKNKQNTNKIKTPVEQICIYQG